MSKGRKAKIVNSGGGAVIINGCSEASAKIKGGEAIIADGVNACNGKRRKSSVVPINTDSGAADLSPVPNGHKTVWVSRQEIAKVFCCLLLALYIRYSLWDTSDDDGLAWSGSRLRHHPLPLLNYANFKAKFPRYKRAKPVEDTRRQLLFTTDLLAVGEQIMSKISGAKPVQKWAQQSPFKSDRTLDEQLDVLSQLDEFNVTQILSALDVLQQQQQQPPLDLPVSGPGAEVEKGNRLQRWLVRSVKSDSHFEIPDYPLDQQPEPAKVTHIDADLRHCSSEIYQQGDCGACYAFSWKSLAEWHYCRQSQGSKQINFSAQHVVDCGGLANLKGCVEGYLTDAKEFSQKFGFYLADEYPYKAKQKVCKNPRGSVEVNVAEFRRVKVDREQWERTLEEQPILLEVHLPSDVLSYQRGVHPGTNCDPRKAHGMLLVGHGRQEGVPYWILKNSMGRRWGENGYLRLSRDAPMSQCFKTGFVAKFKFKSLDDESYHDFYENLKFEPEEQQVQTRAAGKGALDHWFKNP